MCIYIYIYIYIYSVLVIVAITIVPLLTPEGHRGEDLRRAEPQRQGRAEARREA